MLTFPCAVLFFFSSRRRHTRSLCDWSSDVCSSDLTSTSDGELEISVLSLIRPFRSTSTPLFITHGAFLQDIGKVNMLLPARSRSEEHTSELQSHSDLVCRLLLEKKNNTSTRRSAAE